MTLTQRKQSISQIGMKLLIVFQTRTITFNTEHSWLDEDEMRSLNKSNDKENERAIYNHMTKLTIKYRVYIGSCNL